jgi:hypothetical protein
LSGIDAVINRVIQYHSRTRAGRRFRCSTVQRRSSSPAAGVVLARRRWFHRIVNSGLLTIGVEQTEALQLVFDLATAATGVTMEDGSVRGVADPQWSVRTSCNWHRHTSRPKWKCRRVQWR